MFISTFNHPHSCLPYLKKYASIFFGQVSKEKNRFEKLMEYFINDDCNIDFMVGWWFHARHLNKIKGASDKLTHLSLCLQVACMQFINIVVHSVENMNFRVHLQYEFTHLGLDTYLQVSPLNPQAWDPYWTSSACKPPHSIQIINGLKLLMTLLPIWYYIWSKSPE